MGTFRLLGLLAIIPASVLLTISFFVLFTLRKTEVQGLKAFGYVIAVLLWIGVLLVLSVGAYTLSTGRHPMMYMMQQMMPCHMRGIAKEGQVPSMMERRRHGMMKGNMPAMMQEEEAR